MANHEHPSGSVPETNQQLVRTTHYGDETPGADGALAAVGPYASPYFSRTPHVVSGGMDFKWFLHSLRRRWLLATSMGLLLAAGAAAGLYYLFPESDTAEARFLVKARPGYLIYDKLDAGANADYDIFRATQIALMKSNPVLQAALQDPTLQRVKALKEAKNQVTWLAENLAVHFEGDSELLRVAMTLNEPQEDLKAMVDAVCNAYDDKVLTQERMSRVKVKDALQTNFRKLNEEIRRKWDQFREIAKDQNITTKEGFDPETQLLMAEIRQKMLEKARIEAEIRQLQLQFAQWQRYRDNPAVKDHLIDIQVAQNRDLMIMDEQLLMLRMQMREASKRSRNQRTREVRRIERDIEALEQEKNRLSSELRQQIAVQQANRPDIELSIYKDQFQTQLMLAAQRLQHLTQGREIQTADGETIRDKGIDELRQELAEKTEESTELMIRQAELEQLESVAKDLAHRIESWEIEKEAEQRITLNHAAVALPGINKAQQYTIAGLGGALTLILTCVGIAYLEFLGRRLNGPDQLDEGLGIRVVGTLPALNAKRLIDPNHPLVAQLTESIDSVRTALMHDSTSKPRQVVLVTSPSAMEGRTTVASQLAASLARAGRRTLLIDGDLRRPALHSLFDVPLEDGLCEVLRAEAEVSDVVRATHAEGLWLMTAGYCDADAVHAMATDQIQPIFEKLRADYDFVIIDAAPVLGLSDSLMMGQHCDGALLSVLRDHTQVPKIYQATELLRSVGIRMIGSVVNGVGEKADRRVTHLQVTTSKATRKQLEAQSKMETEVGVE